MEHDDDPEVEVFIRPLTSLTLTPLELRERYCDVLDMLVSVISEVILFCTNDDNYRLIFLLTTYYFTTQQWLFSDYSPFSWP
jgi:hypothetical protein